MRRRFHCSLTAALVAAFSCLATMPAGAHNVLCGDGPTIIAGLEKGYGERVVSIAFDRFGGLVRTTANPATGTWTLLVTEPGGDTCVMLSGDGWEAIPEAWVPGEPI